MARVLAAIIRRDARAGGPAATTLVTRTRSSRGDRLLTVFYSATAGEKPYGGYALQLDTRRGAVEGVGVGEFATPSPYVLGGEAPPDYAPSWYFALGHDPRRPAGIGWTANISGTHRCRWRSGSKRCVEFIDGVDWRESQPVANYEYLFGAADHVMEAARHHAPITDQL